MKNRDRKFLSAHSYTNAWISIEILLQLQLQLYGINSGEADCATGASIIYK